MGRVIAFERPDRAHRPSRTEGGEKMGEIVFFTGVRYERYVEPSRPSSGPTGSPRRRRRG